MIHGENFNPRRLYSVRQNVGVIRHHQLSSTVDAAWAAELWVTAQQGDTLTNLGLEVKRRVGIILGDILINLA